MHMGFVVCSLEFFFLFFNEKVRIPPIVGLDTETLTRK